LTGETAALGENLPQHHFVHHEYHMARTRIEPGQPQWEPNHYPSELWRGIIINNKVSPITSPKGKGLLPSSRASSVRLIG
jgi:hypothetical protein